MDVAQFVKDKIVWLGHASFRIDGTKSVVYIDPWKLEKAAPADVICITHSHFDHLSVEDIEKIRKPTTAIVGPADCAADFGSSFTTIAPGQSVTIEDVAVKAVPAYNTDKEFHPQQNNWVGYVITIDGVRIYHSGDTDLIPEMSDLAVDVALLPVGGTYTMTVPQAAEAVKRLNPKVAVPMHCGDIVGDFKDREAFEKAVDVPVVILDPQK